MCFYIKLILLSFTLCGGTLQAQTLINVKTKFNAKGDGRTDDTRSFLQAVAQVNKLKKNVVLIIPKGTYLIKPQKPASSNAAVPYEALDILSFIDCSNIEIRGEKGTKIQFAGPLYYGAFKRAKNKAVKLGRRTTEYKYRVAIGHGIHLRNCNGVSVRSIEIDGNNKSFKLGSEYGDVGMQIDNDGIFIQDCFNVSLADLNLHHFGRDGLFVMNKTPEGFNTSAQKISLTNSKFEYNGRQGFSWIGGVGFMATNCSFSYTGKGKFASPPSAGIDLEPNAGYIVKEGVFTNCVFKGNNGVAVLADEGGGRVKDIKFIGCTIQGEVGPAVWVRSPGLRFYKCDINGSFFFGFAASKPEDGTQFLDCTFTDLYSGSTNDKYLVESNGARHLLFSNCVFRAFTKATIYVNAGASTTYGRTVFNNCHFITLKLSSEAASGRRRASFTTGVDFTGNTVFTDSSAGRASWNLERSRFASFDKKSSISIVGRYNLASYDTVAIRGAKAVTVTIENMALLSINHNAKLAIGENGRLIIKDGGSLWVGPGAVLENNGEIIAEKGAYICIHKSAKLSDKSLKNIKIRGKAFFSDHVVEKFGLSGCININHE